MKEYIEREAALDFNFSITVPQDRRIQVCDAVHNTVKAIAAHIEAIPAADVVEYEEVENLLRWAVLHDWTWEEAQEHLQRLRAKMDGGVNDASD